MSACQIESSLKRNHRRYNSRPRTFSYVGCGEAYDPCTMQLPAIASRDSAMRFRRYHLPT